MSRSENVVDCHAENLLWTEDALGFHFHCTKTETDELGRGIMPFGVFMPHLILQAIFVILLCHDSSRGPNKLFPHSNQYECFMKVFLRVIHNNEEAFQHVGVMPGDVGLHSISKSSCNLAASGSTV